MAMIVDTIARSFWLCEISVMNERSFSSVMSLMMMCVPINSPAMSTGTFMTLSSMLLPSGCSQRVSKLFGKSPEAS